jgi:hypothetical protein
MEARGPMARVTLNTNRVFRGRGRAEVVEVEVVGDVNDDEGPVITGAACLISAMFCNDTDPIGVTTATALSSVIVDAVDVRVTSQTPVKVADCLGRHVRRTPSRMVQVRTVSGSAVSWVRC